MQKFWHYRALSRLIAPYRSISRRIAPRAKKLLYLCTANEAKTAVSCSIVQYRAVTCNNVHRAK